MTDCEGCSNGLLTTLSAVRVRPEEPVLSPALMVGLFLFYLLYSFPGPLPTLHLFSHALRKILLPLLWMLCLQDVNYAGLWLNTGIVQTVFLMGKTDVKFIKGEPC
jgi:hypothetical protein